MYFAPKNWQAMRKWLASPLGEYVLDIEQKILEPLLDGIFGANLLVLGEPEFLGTIGELANKHKILLHPYCGKASHLSSLVAGRHDKLPIASESVDIIYLPHCLEMLSNPHEVLREAYRVLRAEGRLLITGFAAASIWGLWKLPASIFCKAPWRSSFKSSVKLIDWLTLLGFEDFNIYRSCYTLPINHAKTLQVLHWLEVVGTVCPVLFSNIYTIVACKRVIPLTPIVPKWRDKEVITGSLTEPSTVE